MFLAPPGGLLWASNNYLPGQLMPPVIGQIANLHQNRLEQVAGAFAPHVVECKAV
jgi:hypothetical protein